MKFILSTLFCLTLFLLGSCKKDYPKDIPTWLKHDIAQLKRTGSCPKRQACIQGAGIWIEECKESTTNTTLYRFGSIDPDAYDYYSADGVYVGTSSTWTNSPTMGPYLNANIYVTRKIWTAQGCK
ncbi:MAG: hypothetical protein JST26_12225 [Bacteroidetes bacterium]|nr:hypothetical protein [Bacteroidota bacterium]